MPKRFHLNQPDQAKAVTDALAACQDTSGQQRLLAMRLAASGQLTAAQIAGQLGMSRRQFFNWVRRLRKEGSKGCSDAVMAAVRLPSCKAGCWRSFRPV
jgi:transposase-like protein